MKKIKISKFESKKCNRVPEFQFCVDETVLKKALEKYNKNELMLCSIDHKDRTNLSMNLYDVAFKHEFLKIENESLVGEVQLIDTPNEKIIAKELVEKKIELKFAPRIMKVSNQNYIILSMDLIREFDTPVFKEDKCENIHKNVRNLQAE